jgi:hypothetical protein
MRRWNDNGLRVSFDSLRTINLNDYYYNRLLRGSNRHFWVKISAFYSTDDTSFDIYYWLLGVQLDILGVNTCILLLR